MLATLCESACARGTGTGTIPLTQTCSSNCFPGNQQPASTVRARVIIGICFLCLFLAVVKVSIYGKAYYFILRFKRIIIRNDKRYVLIKRSSRHCANTKYVCGIFVYVLLFGISHIFRDCVDSLKSDISGSLVIFGAEIMHLVPRKSRIFREAAACLINLLSPAIYEKTSGSRLN